MKHFIPALVAAWFAIGAACAQSPATTATPAHKKAAPAAKHKRVFVKKERTKKAAAF